MSELTSIEKEKALIMGQRLLHIRVHHRLSQRDLAKKLGCNQRYISEWEKGTKLIQTRYLFKICDLFGLDFNYFDPNKEGMENNFGELKESFETAHA